MRQPGQSTRHVLLLACTLFGGCDQSQTDSKGKSMPGPPPERVADGSSIPADQRLKRVSDQLTALLRPSIRLMLAPDAGPPPVGATKLGGRPDLPADTPWPTCRIEMPAPSEAFLKARPLERRLPADGIVHLAFVAQVNLEDVHEFDVDSLLPSAGMLSFFYNPQSFASDTGPRNSVQDMLSGFSYNQYGYGNIRNWQVLYTAPGVDLAPRDFPSTLDDRRLQYAEKAVKLSTERTLPALETSYLPWPGSKPEGLITLTESEWQAYAQRKDNLRGNQEIHQMLGFADQTAGPCDERSYWDWRKQLAGESRQWAEIPTSERLKAAESIRLLLQVGTFDSSGAWWGRNGRLYFFIQESDLRASDFSQVWGSTE